MFLETIQHFLNVLITLSRSSLQFLFDGTSHFLGLLLETQASLFNALQLQSKIIYYNSCLERQDINFTKQ